MADDFGDNEIARIKRRAELLSANEEEITETIDAERPKSSTPAPAKAAVAVLSAANTPGRVVIVLAMLAVIALAIWRGLFSR